MAIGVEVVKRFLKSKKRNGQREYRWALRWFEPGTGKRRCESTGTADRTQADGLAKLKWEQLNIPAMAPEPASEPAKLATWDECRDAVKRAMEADNLRPSYVSDSLLMFDLLRREFPEVEAPGLFTAANANEFKRRRSESKNSPWTTRGDLATLRAVFGKWLMGECGLVSANPFAGIKAPKCDDPDVRIVSAAESKAIYTWLADRWNDWRLPAVYLEVAALVGWRATELASMRTDDLLPDGFVRVVAANSKTRKHKYGWLPPQLRADLEKCSANGWAFGRFSDELRRLLMLWKRMPHHAAKVKDFEPERLVGWLQDELKRFHEDRQAQEDKEAVEAQREPVAIETFTLHDFRRTAITGLQMAGVSEKEASVMVGATPEVIRRHYERLDQQAIARRSVERRMAAEGVVSFPAAQSGRAGDARGQMAGVDARQNSSQTQTA